MAALHWMASFLPMGFVAGFLSFLMVELPAIISMSVITFLVAMTQWKYSQLFGVSLALSYAIERVASYLIVTVSTASPMYWKGFLSGIVGVACVGMLIGLLAWQIGNRIGLRKRRLNKSTETATGSTPDK
jgi:hypothetical protein